MISSTGRSRGIVASRSAWKRPIAGQAQRKELRRRTQHCERMQRSRRNGHRRAWPEVKALILDLNDHATVEDVVGLRPTGAVQWCGGPARRVHLEELVLIISVSRIDLDREDRIRSGELDTIASGT